ncbi:sensor histidine kinase [Niabella hibiscisoli]|uniref:sensor histidine kinase n=1 Tax=Niabella hibiscisoli TaxID=1825928 RepID=UPI00293F59D0|nr:ATP-binding protein [Niabella hibiscisoli]
MDADGTHVQIILQNIISNAIKFTPGKGMIEVYYSFEENYTIIHIRDTGRGMDEKKLQRLFNTSGRLITENGTNEELGTGLGLLLIKQFVEENGGRIAVKSEPGKGSEFIVYFKPHHEPEEPVL